MRKRLSQMAMLAGMILTATFGMPGVASAQTPTPVKIVVRITDNGWNDQGAKFSLNVEQGQQVELTFQWDEKVNLSDEHIFVLEGYNLEWKPINAQNREATVTFTADKPGAFRLKCDTDCEIHDLLKNGVLNVVKKGSGGATASSAPTGPDTRPSSKISIAAPVSAVTGQTVPLQVSATTADGTPIAGAEVHLFETTTFLTSEEATIELAIGVTNKDGQVTLPYSARRSGARPLKVAVDGTAAAAPSNIEMQLTVNAEQAGYLVVPPPGIPGVNRFFVSGVLIVIWGTMFIVAMHVLAIVRAGRTEETSTGEADGNG